MQKTTFEISKMDCPSEENLIRIKLNDISSINNLDFDLSNRLLVVFHEGEINRIEKSILDLKLDGKIINTEEIDSIDFGEAADQTNLLWTVLSINFAFFLIEMATGLISKSMGLVADSLDMLADAFVYGISLIAVGGTVAKKKSIAKTAGYFQIILAVIGFIEVVRRYFDSETLPDFSIMIIISIFALIANGTCLYLLQKSKSQDAHMQASMIFTSNDVIINIGVILAGGLVYGLQSNHPDLIIGMIVFVLVIQGAIRILKLSKAN